MGICHIRATRVSIDVTQHVLNSVMKTNGFGAVLGAQLNGPRESLSDELFTRTKQ